MNGIRTLQKIAAPLALLLATLTGSPATSTTPEARGLEIAEDRGVVRR